MTTPRRRHRSRPVQTEDPALSAPLPAQDNEPTHQSEPTTKPVEALDLEFASPLRRSYAFVVDIGILLMVVYVVGSLTRSSEGIFDFGIIRPGYIDVFIFLAYFIIPTGIFGRTIGKWVAGISVVLFDEKRQGWHDKIAGTYVVVIPNSGGPGFLARMFTTQDEDKSDQNRQQRVGRPTTRRRRRNRRRN